MTLQLFIIGPSGCGKSTQAKMIADKYHLVHFSMGQLLRDQIELGTPLGIDAKKSVDTGVPVPDDIVLPILSQKIQSLNYQNFIIDGFPRVLNQGHYIDRFLIDKGVNTSLVIHLMVDFLEIIRRRQKLGQGFQDDSRTDNTPQAIANRQKILYESNVGPILGYYRKLNQLYEVDGNRPIEPIFADICREIDKIK